MTYRSSGGCFLGISTGKRGTGDVRNGGREKVKTESYLTASATLGGKAEPDAVQKKGRGIAIWNTCSLEKTPGNAFQRVWAKAPIPGRAPGGPWGGEGAGAWGVAAKRGRKAPAAGRSTVKTSDGRIQQ